jgi:hypothetical protein
MSSNRHCQVFHFLRDGWFQFAKLEKLHLTISKNPWANHPKCSGSKFYEDVLSRRPPTVEEAVRLGKHFGFSEDDVQFHLLWLYTDNKNPLEISGKPFSTEVKEWIGYY